MQKLSVLVPVYNVEKYIKRCVDSLKNQTYKNLEIIFVDDCSTDNSLKILQKEIKDMSNAKILQHDENKGLFLARLTALLDCTGEYIAFLDSDDYVDHNFYETYIKVITQKNADMCLCDYRFTNENGFINSIIKKPFIKLNLEKEKCFKYLCSRKIVRDQYIYLWSKIINRKLFDKTKQQLLEISKNAKNIIGGEDCIYTTVFATQTNKLISGTGAYYNYFKHENQSVKIINKQKALSYFESHIRSNILIRDFTIKHNLYDVYNSYDMWWVEYIKLQTIMYGKMLDCTNEYDNLLKKYNFDKIIKIVTYTHKVLNKK